LDECKKRDVRGSYGPNHVDPSYEKPERADLSLDLSQVSVEEAAATVIGLLEKKGFLKP
jgi:adenylylsulfate kinase-like enzyme